MDLSKQKIIVLIILYLLVIGVAEFSIAYYSLNVGLFIHVVIMLFLIFLSAHIKGTEYSRLLLGFALVPLIRILSVSIPLVVFFDPIYVFVLIYTPLLLSSFIFLKSQKISMEEAGITSKNLKLQIFIGLGGLFFGAIEYIILEVYFFPMARTTNLGEIISAIIIMVFFIGFTEELIFRGIILRDTAKILGTNKSMIFNSILFMLMHTGFRSPLYLCYVFAVSMFYCYAFIKTRSIIGITICHGLTNAVGYVILPAFFYHRNEEYMIV